jgi:hypothetical protein
MSTRDQGQPATAPRVQDDQQGESPFRKVISVLQVCTNPLVITLAQRSPSTQQILLIYAVTQFGEAFIPALPYPCLPKLSGQLLCLKDFHYAAFPRARDTRQQPRSCAL